MPLKIIETKKGARPAIFCDCCGQEIDDVEKGNYHWTEDPARADCGVLYFSCKSGCCMYVDRVHNTPCCLELSDLFYLLTNNLRFDPKVYSEGHKVQWRNAAFYSEPGKAKTKKTN